MGEFGCSMRNKNDAKAWSTTDANYTLDSVYNSFWEVLDS
jgi:hypothetical protein